MYNIGEEFLIYYPSTKWRIIREDVYSFILADVVECNLISTYNNNDEIGYYRRKIDKLDFLQMIADKIAKKV